VVHLLLKVRKRPFKSWTFEDYSIWERKQEAGIGRLYVVEERGGERMKMFS
jgi:hypothetical protein